MLELFISGNGKAGCRCQRLVFSSGKALSCTYRPVGSCNARSGSTVTHAAVKSLSSNNCLLAWTGQDGVGYPPA